MYRSICDKHTNYPAFATRTNHFHSFKQIEFPLIFLVKLMSLTFYAMKSIEKLNFAVVKAIKHEIFTFSICMYLHALEWDCAIVVFEEELIPFNVSRYNFLYKYEGSLFASHR